MKNDFKDAKVGDRVWDIMHGWGKIIEIYKDPEVPYPIKVSDFENESLYTETYTCDGKAFKNHINPILFWDKINIKPPPIGCIVGKPDVVDVSSGKCRRCGTCCSLLSLTDRLSIMWATKTLMFSGECKFLDFNTTCTIYKNRPMLCKSYKCGVFYESK